MKILHVLPSVDPAGGGPPEGVRQRGVRLQEMEHTVHVLTLDDPGAAFLVNYPLRVFALGPSSGGYRYNAKLKPWLQENAGSYDAVVIGGLWQYHSFGAWRALRGKVPYFVFTHGMLDPWFKKAYPLKHLKKWLYWPWADYRVLRDAKKVLFTSEEERVQARRSFSLYKAREEVVAYGTQTPPSGGAALAEKFLNAFPGLKGRRLILYLSRIHPKKGCDHLVEAFSQAARRDPNLHLVMAGPDHTGWQPKLMELARAQGMEDRITWPGMLAGEMKWGAFNAAEAFILPSHQENFGIAVAEALGCGLPVLISNKVNIWREIEADGAGFVAENSLKGTAELLDRWLSLSPSMQEAMRGKARGTFEKRYSIDAMALSLLHAISTCYESAESIGSEFSGVGYK